MFILTTCHTTSSHTLAGNSPIATANTLTICVCAVFCFFYCYDGLFRERQFELLAFVGATGVIFTYVVGSYIFDAVRHNGISDVKNASL